MYSLNIICYLFFSGTGGGLFLATVFTALCTRNHDALSLTHIGTSIVFVALGGLSLLGDLGSPANLLYTLSTTHISLLTIGAWSLILFTLSAIVLFLVLALSYTAYRRLTIVLTAVSSLTAIVLVVYTGLFLATMRAVPFHHTWSLAVLIALSSCDTGYALYQFVALVSSSDTCADRGFKPSNAPAIVLLVLESLALALFLYISSTKGADVAYSLNLILTGSLSLWFWGGAVFIGLAIPLFFDLLAVCTHGALSGRAETIAPLCCVAGGFALKYAVAKAGFTVFQLSFL